MSYRYLAPPPGIKEPIIQHIATGGFIPRDPANKEFQDFEAWLAAGNTPEVPPPPEGDKR